MTNEKQTLLNGARILPQTFMSNLIPGIMNISDYGCFRPATQSKDFDKDYKDFDAQRKAFFDMINEAITDDRIYKLTRRNYADALAAILDPESPILREIKDGFVEISFVIKLK